MQENQMTTAVQEALAQAQQIAQTRHHQEIDLPHLFKFLIQPGEFGAELLQQAGVDLTGFEKELDRQLDGIAVVEGSVQYGQTLSQPMYRLLAEADQLRKQQDDEYIALDTIFLALLKLTANPVALYLKKQGLTFAKLAAVVKKITRGRKSDFQKSRNTI